MLIYSRRTVEAKVEGFYAAILRRSDYRSAPLAITNGPDPDLYGGGRKNGGSKAFDDYGGDSGDDDNYAEAEKKEKREREALIKNEFALRRKLAAKNNPDGDDVKKDEKVAIRDQYYKTDFAVT